MFQNNMCLTYAPGVNPLVKSVAEALVIAGSLNWLVLGLSGNLINPVAIITAPTRLLTFGYPLGELLVYGLVGISGLVLVYDRITGTWSVMPSTA